MARNNHRTDKYELDTGKEERGVKDGDKNEIIFPKRPVLGMC